MSEARTPGISEPPAPGMALEWGVVYDMVDPATGLVGGRSAQWGLRDHDDALELAMRINVLAAGGAVALPAQAERRSAHRRPEDRLVRRHARPAHRWVGQPEVGTDVGPAPATWNVVESLLLQLVRATGQPEGTVRLGLGLPLSDAV